jgi:hypothetical protein
MRKLYVESRHSPDLAGIAAAQFLFNYLMHR